MPNPFSSTFTTIKTNLTWSFTTEARENLVWTFTTTNTELTWSFTTLTRNAVWSFTTASDLVWSFTTEAREDLEWTFTTVNLPLTWSFTTDDGITILGEFTSYVPIFNSDCKDIRIGVKFDSAKTDPSYRITNLRTGKVYTGTITGSVKVLGVTLTNIKDAIYEVTTIVSSTIQTRDYLLVNCNNCLYDLAKKNYFKTTCKDCRELSELRAITNAIKAAHQLGEFNLAHNLMDVLDDVCLECANC